MFRVRAPGLGPFKGLEARLNSGGVLQPSARQERSSLDGRREGSTWLPPGSLLLFQSVATGLWPLGFLGSPGREVTKFPLLSGNVLPAAPCVHGVSNHWPGGRLVAQAQISEQVGEQNPFLESAYIWRRRKGSHLKYLGLSEGKCLSSPSWIFHMTSGCSETPSCFFT